MKKFFIAVTTVALATFGVSMAGAVELSGVAYIQTHGGHVAALDLATGDVARFNHGKPSDAVTVSKDGKTLFNFSLDGNSSETDVATGKTTEWQKLGKKHCGSNYAPDGTIWVSDMADGHVYVYDPKSKKLVDSFPVAKSICGVNFSKDGKYAYVSDMPGGFIAVVDVKTKKVVNKIEGAGNFIHRAEVSKDGSELWQSDGSELVVKDGKKTAIGVGYATGEATPGSVAIIDLKSGKLKDRVLIGGNPHDVTFTPDGKYALVVSRQLPERTDSAVIVVDTATKRVVKMYSACKACHGPAAVEIDEKKDGGRPFLCAIDVDWNAKKLPAGAEPLASFTEK